MRESTGLIIFAAALFGIAAATAWLEKSATTAIAASAFAGMHAAEARRCRRMEKAQAAKAPKCSDEGVDPLAGLPEPTRDARAYTDRY